MQNPKRGRSVLAFSAVISMLKNRRHFAEAEVQTRVQLAIDPIYKGAIEKNHS